MLELSWRLVLAGCIKSILDCLYKARLRPMLVVCCSGASSVLSSSAMVPLPGPSRDSLVRTRASSTILARVARVECCQSLPFASATPRAILSRRFEGGTGPLKGVSRCEGNASRVCKLRTQSKARGAEKTRRDTVSTPLKFATRREATHPLQETNLLRFPLWLNFAHIEIGAVPTVRAVPVRVCREQRQWLGAFGGGVRRGSGARDESTHLARAKRQRERRERRSGGRRPTVHNCPRG